MMKLPACLKISFMLSAGIVALIGSGCIIPSQQGVKDPQTETQSNPPINMAPPGKLLKPTIQESAEPSGQPEAKTVPEYRPPQPASEPAREVTGPEQSEAKPLPASAPKDVKQESEDQKVKKAALERAKLSPSTRKIKICLAVKDDEWWVTLSRVLRWADKLETVHLEQR